MRIAKRSVITGRENIMDLDVTMEQIKEWQAGALVQDVFPHLTEQEREFLISGTTQAEWDEYIPEDDDE